MNTYGFEVGGPVYIPKVIDGRNKFFWHTAYEGFKNRGVGATRIARVPTPAQVASVTDPTARALLQQYPSAKQPERTDYHRGSGEDGRVSVVGPRRREFGEERYAVGAV